MPEEREWTVMFYLASDNPLAPGVVSHLKAMKNAGYHPQVNVLAQFDPHTVNTPTHIFDVNRIEKLKNPGNVNIGFRANDSFVRNLVADKIWDDEITQKIRKSLRKRLPNISYNPPPLPRKMRDDELSPAESLLEFLKFCHRNYPARHYMLFILGHGVVVGNDLFLTDQHVATKDGKSESQSLLLTELGCIMREFKKSLGKRGQLELIGFHSCSMSGVEVAFQLQGTANYMLAAQGPTYTGAWAYQQILIRLFNEMNSSRPFTRDDIGTNGLVDRLLKGRDPASRFFRDCFNGNGEKLLKGHLAGKPPQPKLVTAMVRQFKHLLDDPNLCDVQEFRENLSPLTKQLIRKHRATAFDEHYLRWLNRRVLLENFPQRIVSADPGHRIKHLVKNIFNYCLYNSFDFQLAGYSCDVSLCDLNKVHFLEQPVADLVSSLRAGLKSSAKTKYPLVRDLILLAHWEAQSFYEEKYTDLYDFCFRLKVKCEEAKSSLRTMNRVIDRIVRACGAVMDVLKRGTHRDNDRLIIRSEFCGPAYQYAHGMSIFFPWSEPVGSQMWDKQYEHYAFSRTKWREFLKDYFKQTMRRPRGEEWDDRDVERMPSTLDRELLELLSDMNTLFFNDEGLLGKGGSKDPLGPAKGGSRDPTGGDCECGSIKNYPHFTQPRVKKGRIARKPEVKAKRPAVILFKQLEETVR